jgi:hypothetical protein
VAKAKNVTVHGVRETEQAFNKLQQDIDDMTAVHEAVMRNRLPGVRELTPVLSGALRDSWEALGSPDSGSILSPLPYAPPVEYGVPSRGVAPVGMVNRTLVAQAKQMDKEYEQAINELAKKRGFKVV